MQLPELLCEPESGRGLHLQNFLFFLQTLFLMVQSIRNTLGGARRENILLPEKFLSQSKS